MSANRLRLVLTAIFVAVMVALLLWGRSRDHTIAVRQTLDRMDRDVDAAKAAAAGAAISAG